MQEQNLKGISAEVFEFMHSRKSLMLSSITPEGAPYASYAPFAVGEDVLYVLLSDVAVHAVNLKENPQAGVLIVEDEDTARELFARKRVSYSMKSQWIDPDSEEWQQGVNILAERLGDRINKLSELSDFNLFRLEAVNGRYVKGFGRAYGLGSDLFSEGAIHLNGGHGQRRAKAS